MINSQLWNRSKTSFYKAFPHKTTMLKLNRMKKELCSKIYSGTFPSTTRLCRIYNTNQSIALIAKEPKPTDFETMLRGQDSDLLRKLMGLPGKPFPTLPRDEIAAHCAQRNQPLHYMNFRARLSKKLPEKTIGAIIKR